jgi:hypothetical protein
MGGVRFAKTLKCSLRISRFFEGAREKLRETIVVGRCNLRASQEVVAVIFTPNSAVRLSEPLKPLFRGCSGELRAN